MTSVRDANADLIRRLQQQTRPPRFGKDFHSGVKPNMTRVREAMRLAGERIKADNLSLGARNARAITPTAGPVTPLRDFGQCGHFPPCPSTAHALYLTGPRCPAHTPAALADRPETTPDPARTLDGLRRAAGANPNRPMTPAGSTLVDQRAIASGKRRSRPSDYRAAQAATR